MAALRSLEPEDRVEVERELAAARADVARFRFALARPEVSGAWAVKIGWQLCAAERAVVRLERLVA